MRQYEQHLPHWEVLGQPLFVTLRLQGSLPTRRVFPPARLTSGRDFVSMDRMLDQTRTGPLFLRQPEIARLVIQALADGEVRLLRYHLHAFVVMPNHLHLLLTPRVPTKQWLGPLMGFTGSRANELLGRRWVPFWQAESYDHPVQDEEEFRRVQSYIEFNPVGAGLVALPEEFAWSSAAGWDFRDEQSAGPPAVLAASAPRPGAPPRVTLFV